MFFFTITLHLLAIHGTQGLQLLGHFWATNMLPIERIHVVLKRLIRGASRNPMQTLANNLALYKQTAYERFEDDFALGTAYPNSLAAMRQLPENDGAVQPVGGHQGQHDLEPENFKKLLEMWALSFTPLEKKMALFEKEYDGKPPWLYLLITYQ